MHNNGNTKVKSFMQKNKQNHAQWLIPNDYSMLIHFYIYVYFTSIGAISF